MDGIGTAGQGDCDDLLPIEIAFARVCRADVVRLIRIAHMLRHDIHIGIDSNRRDPEVATGTDNSESDLAAIGDQDLLEH